MTWVDLHSLGAGSLPSRIHLEEARLLKRNKFALHLRKQPTAALGSTFNAFLTHNSVKNYCIDGCI